MWRSQAPPPLALVEVGASAGLTMLYDRYSYGYGGHYLAGRDPLAPTLRCRPSGPVPLPTGIPAITRRAGLDLNPLDVNRDDDVRWLFNLYYLKDGIAELGYRVAQHVAGHGVATAAVRELCGLAAARHGLRTLRAATSHANVASQKVLAKAGFVPVCPADSADLGGKPGTWYQLDLAADRP
jgi:hypothetical protein